MKRNFVIGTRGSRLALVQAEKVKAALNAINPSITISLKIIRTSGDLHKDANLAEIGGKELFTKEIDLELTQGLIDLAVHSLKDVPGIVDPRLEIAGALKREDARDTLIGIRDLSALPKGAVVATSSPRRKAQVLSARPDVIVAPIRGNVETRIEKIKNKEAYCTILAIAGINRLGLKIEHTPLSLNEFVPAVGQGVIAIAVPAENEELKKFVKEASHLKTFNEAAAERAALAAFGGNCYTAIAAHATSNEDDLQLHGFIANDKGSISEKLVMTGKVPDAGKIGEEMGNKLLEIYNGF